MTVTNYLWDDVSDNVLMEYDENGVTLAENTHEPGEFGELISQRRNGITSYYHYDATGSTRFLTDEAGNRTDTYIYSGFGETIAKTGTTTNPYRYVGALGYYFDEKTEEYYVRARAYNPTIARFTSTDPFMFFDESMRFVYAANDPVNMVDPSGLREINFDGRPIRCTVEVVCNTVGYLLRFKHCGVKVSGCGVNKEYHAGGGPSMLSGNPTTCDVTPYELGESESKTAGWIANRWTFSDCSVCKCIKDTVGIVNKQSWDYDYLPANDSCGDDSNHCNSNYIAKCLLRKCGIDKVEFGGAGAPVGWSHRAKKCVHVTFSTVPATDTVVAQECCTCEKWRTIDTSWCGPA